LRGRGKGMGWERKTLFIGGDELGPSVGERTGMGKIIRGG